jgi:type VI secretion system secreted protein Hcp
MAVDFFLSIDGIEGESTDSKHKGQIDVMSWSWGESSSGSTSGGGGGGAGKVSMQDFAFSARLSKASPALLLACASGKHLKSAVLTARKAGKGQQEFLTFSLSDLLVSSYQTGGSEGDEVGPVDAVSLNFSKIEMEYKHLQANGKLGDSFRAGWDVKQNKSF